MTGDSRKHWFYLLPQDTEESRLIHAARLTEKAWQQGDHVGLFCDSEAQAQTLDDLLWSFRPDAFIPHQVLGDSADAVRDRVAIFWHEPSPDDWQTLIVLSRRLPPCSDQFPRLALIANSDPDTLQQARGHYRQLKELGVDPQVLDLRTRHV